MMHPKDAKDKSQFAPFMAGKEKSHPNPSQRQFYGTPKSMAGGHDEDQARILEQALPRAVRNRVPTSNAERRSRDG